MLHLLQAKAEYLREEHLESSKDEKEEAATERRKDYTNLKLNLADFLTAPNCFI